MGVGGAGGSAARVSARACLAALFAAGLVGLACTGVLVTTEARWISLLVEPLSLLLLPGLIVSLAVAGAHDFSPALVVRVSAAFYFLICLLLLSRRRRTQRRWL